MKAWLKGGFIGAEIAVVLSIILFLIMLIGDPNNSGLFFLIMIMFFGGESLPYALIPAVAVYFLIGALIGWLIGKRKK